MKLHTRNFVNVLPSGVREMCRAWIDKVLLPD